MANLFKSLPKIDNMNNLEVLLLILFVIYLIFPIGTPEFLRGFIISPMGYVLIFIVTLYLFFYSHPILAILYIFVAYELLNRSNVVTKNQASSTQTKQVRFDTKADVSQSKKDVELAAMNPPAHATLEEEVVNKLAPIGVSQETNYVITDFHPVADNIDTASVYK